MSTPLSANLLLQYLSWAVFLLIFAIVAAKAIRHPLRANIDIALLFSAPALIIVISVAAALGLIQPGSLTQDILVTLLLAIAYLLLRLVDDFLQVPAWLMRGAGVSLPILAVVFFMFPLPRPGWLSVPLLLYLVVLLIYSAVAFIRESVAANGVTSRRMRAVAAGSLVLCLEFLISSLNLVFPTQASLWQLLTTAAGLATGVCYFFGFAPPALLRRAWQEPELRAFLGRAANLPRLPDTAAIIAELEQGAASSLGAPNARIGLWDEQAQLLRFPHTSPPVDYAPDRLSTTGRAFLNQRPDFSADVERDNPTYRAESRAAGAKSLLAAPITAGDKRLGVLVVYAPRAPIFADDDIALIQLLADQAAVILESRTLIDEAARVRAREEATRLKEDFLSAAAHDLKTPLTTLVAKAQLLERRALRNPEAPVDLAGLQVLVREGLRLKRLVLELLDATRAEQGQLVGERTEVDLVAVAQEVCERQCTDRHPCQVEASGPVIGRYDQVRIAQLLDNLIENAVKYSPRGGAVRVRVWSELQEANLSVSDAGIGIPADDLPHVFDRFYRGTNVDDRRFAGMGLGLFICRGIAEQHGGKIWASSCPGEGSTFHVALPLASEEEAVYG